MAKNNRRVLMIISQFYPLLGGAELQAQLLASSLIKRGMKVSVLTRKLKGLPKYETIEGIPVYREIKTIELGFLWGIYYIVSVFMFLYKRRKDYDIIHCHIVQEFQTIVAVLFKLFFNKKVIVKMSSSGETSDFKVLKEVKFGRLFLRLIRNVDAIISVCKKSSEEILENGFSKETLVEIPNGIDTSKFLGDTFRGRKNIRNITYVGRLDSYKGVNYLLAGFKELLSKVGNIKLTIVGSGPDETVLKNMARDLNIIDGVAFKGRQEDVLSELDSTDIFVLPSLSEGMPNVLLEAMACELPVVATYVGGNSDLIKDRHNGLLIPPKDSISLSEALLELLEDDELVQRLGKEARKTVEANYSMGHIVDKYVKLYSRLVS
jgi:glycosyltransferase involved in cell wall biosynthesis